MFLCLEQLGWAHRDHLLHGRLPQHRTGELLLEQVYDDLSKEVNRCVCVCFFVCVFLVTMTIYIYIFI